MSPQYLNEARHSHLVATWAPPSITDYESQSPLTSFERRAHEMSLDGQQHLHREEFRLALDVFNELHVQAPSDT